MSSVCCLPKQFRSNAFRKRNEKNTGIRRDFSSKKLAMNFQFRKILSCVSLYQYPKTNNSLLKLRFFQTQIMRKKFTCWAAIRILELRMLNIVHVPPNNFSLLMLSPSRLSKKFDVQNKNKLFSILIFFHLDRWVN